MTTTAPRSTTQDSAVSAVWTLLSRITGLVRVVLIGAVLGPSFVGNLFQLANQLPWLLFEITIGGLIGSLIVPVLVDRAGSGIDRTADLDVMSSLASAFTSTIAVAFATVSLVVMAGAPLVSRLFAAGAPAGLRDDLVRAGIPLILLTAPQMVGYALTVTAQAIQHAMGSFAIPAAAGIAENVFMAAALVVYAIGFGTNTAVADLDMARLLVLGVGSSLGVAAHVAIQFWGVRRLGVRIRPTRGWRVPEVRAVVRHAMSAAGAASLNGVRILVVLLLANTVAGGVVALQLGLNLVGVAVALGAKPVAYSMLPRLAAYRRGADESGYRNEYRRGLGLAGLMVIPAAIAVTALGWALGPALSFGAMSAPQGRELMALTVSAIGGAIIGEALFQLGIAASFGRGRSRPPLIGYALRLVLAVGLISVALTNEGSARIAGIALAMGAADLIAGLVVHVLVHRDIEPSASTYDLRRSLGATTAAAVVGFGSVAMLAAAVTTDRSDPALTTAVVAAVCGGILYLFGRDRLDPELRGLRAELRPGGND